ncbi:MAG: cytochrome c3 family protein, partial [Deltaproteobacteria bacterium]|nr:cytochrome c3 family protein [Deltaproteobacteria bacterium]
DDCETCHHHASSVEHTPPCRECHGLSSDDLDRPGLKGAYHRQCMNCHREMGSGPMGCEDCHAKLPVGDRPSPERLAREAAPQKMRLGHLAREYSGVDFDHRLHTELTEGCAQCHHKQKGLEVAPPCRECHNTPENLKAAYHEQCIGCHRKDDQGPTDCSDCHATK